jgi:hypothetical protein
VGNLPTSIEVAAKGRASGAAQKVRFSITIRTATVMAAASSADIAATIIASHQVIEVALGGEIVRFAQNSIAQLCRATLAASRQLDDANGDRLLRVCVTIEL